MPADSKAAAFSELEIWGTFGPASSSQKVLAALLQAGMNGIRLNLSHGALSKAAGWIDALDQARKQTGLSCSLLIDLQGRELRLKDDPAFTCLQLDPGQIIALDAIPMEEFLKNQLQDGDVLLLDDGKIRLHLQTSSSGTLEAVVKQPGILLPRKSIKVEGRRIEMPALCSMDLKNLAAARQFGVDAVMVPFVNSRKDLEVVHAALQQLGLDLKIYAKLETVQGAENLEQFADLADQIVIARGDLANDCGIVQLPALQYQLEQKLQALHKPYMVVTQMLDSMSRSPICTRAEANDVFWAVARGADAIMLTGETAAGQFPVQAMELFRALAAEGWKARHPENHL